MAHDLRFAIRFLLKNPGFSAIAVLTFTLGLAATTTVFSLVNTVLIQPLPFRDPERLVWIANSDPGDMSLSSSTTHAGTFADWQSQNQSFERLGAYFAFFDYAGQTLIGRGDPVRLRGVGVSQDFLGTLAVTPRIGRNFSEDECRWNGPKAVILTDRLWKTRFQGEPNIVGQTISLRDDLASVTDRQAKIEPYVVVGVLPATFDFASIFAAATTVDLLLPFPISAETENWGNMLSVLGRLKQGTTIAQAQKEFELLDERIRKAHPERGINNSTVMSPLRLHVSGDYRRALVLLTAAVLCVLLVACVNLSNLLLARAADRRKEVALRLALGARRWQVVRQRLTESTLLAGAGALLALPLAHFATRMIAESRLFDVPLIASASLDLRVAVVALFTTTGCGILAGLLPALRHSRVEVNDDLKDSGRGSTQGQGYSRFRDRLVVLEVTATCVLLVGTGLLSRSLLALLEVDLGFHPERTATCPIQPSRDFAGPEEQTAYYRALIDTVAALPGVESAGLSDALPFGRSRSWIVRAKGTNYREGEAPEAQPRIVDDGYLKAMKIPLREGRYFDRDDLGGKRRVAIINSTLARQFWPATSAVGKTLVGDGEFEVVGVVGDVRHAGLDRATAAEIYLLGSQAGWSNEDLVVRTRSTLATLIPEVRIALRRFDPGMPIGEFRSMGEIIGRSVSGKKLIAILLSLFSALGVALAAMGIYGVIACSIGQRTTEIGVRVALGATPRDILGLVIGQGMKPVGLGLLAGTLAALAATRMMRSQLFGVSATDPLTFVLMGAVVVVAALLACWLPARRATRVDPVVALRKV